MVKIMTNEVYNNWVKMKKRMEDGGSNFTNNSFYERAFTCVATRKDPGIPGGDAYYQHFLKFFCVA